MRYFVAIALLVASVHAGAKCVESTYEVMGKVVGAAGQGLSGVTIKAEWDEWSGKRSAKAISTSDGSYTLRISFNTLSGETSTGDLCERRLETIRLVAVAEGLKPISKAIAVKAQREVVNLSLNAVPAE